MMEQVFSVSELLRTMLPSVRQKAGLAVEKLKQRKIRRVLLTGCGDSIGATLSARQLFLRCTGLPVQVETAIDLSRHIPSGLLAEEGTLIVIVSNSGNVSRVIELAKRVEQLGGVALAVTGNEDSELYRRCEIQLKLETPKFHRSGPGMRSYCACLLGLFELATALGVALGAMPESEAKEIRQEIGRLPEWISAMQAEWKIQAQHIAEQLKACGFHEFVGDGSDYGTAWFGFAKELEVAALPGCVTNTEDWLHMNYFVRNVRGTALYVVANENSPAVGRSKELLHIATEMERPVVCVTDSKSMVQGVEKSSGAAVLTTPTLKFSELNPLIQYLPLSMMMASLGTLLGETDFRGTQEHWTACIEFATIAKSEEMIIK